MAHSGKHVDTSRATRRAFGSPGVRVKASLAMVVCFIGFQGIVPEAGSPADATTLEAARVFSDSSSTADELTPTGTVGASLLTPVDTQDALDPLDPRPAHGASIRRQDSTKAAATAPEKRPASGTLFAPVADLVPTSSFGFRTSPITGEAGEFHTGQDYAAPCGTTVFAADAGTVRAVGWHPWGGGNRVEVDHGNGLITTYNHLQGISVRAGDTVNGGDPIAAIGTTGSSTGCHLHFETILDGEHVDPLRWTLVHTAPGASKGELKDFTPGGASAADIPAWAQSSTRSDQPMPVIAPLPASVDQVLPDVVVPGVPAGPPPGSGQQGPSDVQPAPLVTAPPVTAVPGPQQAPPGKPLATNKPESTKPDTDVPGTGHTVKPGPTPPKHTDPKPPKGETPTPPKDATPPPKHTDPKPPKDATPQPTQKPDAPKPPKPETPSPVEPAPVDPAVPAPEVPEVPVPVTPSCDVDPSPATEEADLPGSDPAAASPAAEPVEPAEPLAASTDAGSADGQGSAADGEPVTEDPADEDAVSCEDQDLAGGSEDAPTEGAPGTPTPEQAGHAAVAPASEQG